MSNTVILGETSLTVADVVAVAREGARVEIAPAALDRVAATRRIIDDLANDTRPHYGVSTGFGALAKVQIPLEKRQQLQRSLSARSPRGQAPRWSGRWCARSCCCASTRSRAGEPACGPSWPRPTRRS